MRHLKSHETYLAEVITREVVRIAGGQKGILPSVLSRKEKTSKRTYCIDCNKVFKKSL